MEYHIPSEQRKRRRTSLKDKLPLMKGKKKEKLSDDTIQLSSYRGYLKYYNNFVTLYERAPV
jgi:hypothetical protein